MNYRYRVTLSGIKGFYRVYVVNGDNSLYTFHKQLRADLEFPMDQPILFKALDAEGDVVARYALMDIGYGAVEHQTEWRHQHGHPRPCGRENSRGHEHFGNQ